MLGLRYCVVARVLDHSRGGNEGFLLFSREVRRIRKQSGWIGSIDSSYA